MDNNDVKTKREEKKHKEEKELDREVEELKKKVEELENNWKRAIADYQNLEKRFEAEKKEWIQRANKDLLLHLLPVLDTLMIAIKHVKIQDEGLNLSIKQFQDVLEEEGVEKIETVGKQFDPRFMQCVDTMDGEEGKVLQEVQAGYKLHDTLLRASLVKVGKAKQEKEEEEKAKKELQKGDYM